MKLHHELIYQLTGRERKQQQHPQVLANRREIRVPFTFESGPLLHFKRDLNQLWKQFYVYQNSPLNDISLRIESRINKSLNQLLSLNKPMKALRK